MADKLENSIAEAFRTLHPTTIERNALERNAGRVVIALSRIEDDLIFMFGVLCGIDQFDQAIKVFSEINGVALKLKIINVLVLKEGDAAEIKRWKKCYSTLMQHRSVRNLVAHQPLTYENPEDEKLTRVVLSPSFFGSKHKGKSLDAKTVGASAEALEELTDEVYGIAKVMMLRLTRLKVKDAQP